MPQSIIIRFAKTDPFQSCSLLLEVLSSLDLDPRSSFGCFCFCPTPLLSNPHSSLPYYNQHNRPSHIQLHSLKYIYPAQTYSPSFSCDLL
ncbi:hypothetical protein PGT21_036351 [Puccinia graminis f. sp. tritici]|uniref:Uncharacterized protein n=1 Tax=Puccinia graminis f. sp. tritici TaxID=56615 RepID=A0A5B0RLD8_PUCGR|nr:hypothetical protein PGT21_036351 [Puccinia graminis f. sp. tritici]KAA1126219.1 hypothetical protein PGTUg99_015967 [Puccinia graminis f. sp. tritici]